ncbi:phosphatidylserine decarboxylase [Deinococcus hopiensis]|uniref:Phosphatidylserine decarboxylase n=1 Tax=Deinococcus hopiensis KR-140 TaxID=695939 RepID=A0A1W1VH21_9DEIO|nr:phosphatidylserine decarboxylase [Deinococcus hopiensis]SMB92685.1 phosphatidylserine decarboxylase [Deinococcus hopiensis KR-140]
MHPSRRVLSLAALGVAAWLLRQTLRGRDPVRLTQPGWGEVLSPADGVVAFVRRVEEGKVVGDAPLDLRAFTEQDLEDGWLLGILLGPLDARYVYAPAEGTVGDVRLTGGPGGGPLLNPLQKVALLGGLPADPLGQPNLEGNERHTTVLTTAQGHVGVTLLAGGKGLGAITYAGEGDALNAGQKLAYLEASGGAVLLTLSAVLVPQVSVGDRVVGARTVVARKV